MADNFNYEIKEALGVIASGEYGSKEVNIISYNGHKPKFDIRNWKSWEDGSKHMDKGLTLTEEEAKELCKVLVNYFRSKN